ncbi:MAG: hypothetical protein U0401_25980 [Anaerolineae bacterium]
MTPGKILKVEMIPNYKPSGSGSEITCWVYWVATPYDQMHYQESYKRASAAPRRHKRSQLFEAVEENGLKDSLGGKPVSFADEQG